ncbi:MAG: hypothetical protein QM813_00950 [Verrucomicrobiota bacterium]
MNLRLLAGLGLVVWATAPTNAPAQSTNATKPQITQLTPPEKDFFSKELDYQGIPIKAHQVVSDEAIYVARERLAMMLQHLPVIASNLVSAKVALHIIGKDQVTTDLPEWRHDKGKPLAEYNGLTRDQRTRGMGGRLVSCGEENLLKLEKDKYHGRDICVHEFTHAIRNQAMSQEARTKFDQQYERSIKKGLWVKGYAAVNADEFFSELSMWYFGTHGDMNMVAPKPDSGPDGLKKYDPEAYALFDDFYQGRMAAARQPASPLPED